MEEHIFAAFAANLSRLALLHFPSIIFQLLPLPYQRGSMEAGPPKGPHMSPKEKLIISCCVKQLSLLVTCYL